MFGGDPFDPFGNMRRHMAEMDRMMAEPFGMMNQMNQMMNQMLGPTFGHPAMMLDDGMSGRRRGQPHGAVARRPVDPFDMMGFGGFGFGGGLMNHAMSDPNSMVFSSSTMITMNPDGTQRVVSNSTRKAGDVKETRHAVRDGEDERVAVGHHIGDRSHYVEKKRDKDGQFRQKQSFVNLDADKAGDFDTEFKSRANRNISGLFGGRPAESSRRAIDDGRGSSSRYASRPSAHHPTSSSANAPIVTIPDDDEEEARPQRRSNRYGDDDDVIYTGTQNRSGPTIREISDEEAEAERTKRRKGMFGKFFSANDD